MQKIYSYLLKFSGKTHSVCTQLLNSNQKAPFLPNHICIRTQIQLLPTYVESLRPHFGKVSFFKFGPANWESIGNIHRVSNWVFSVSSYILVLDKNLGETDTHTPLALLLLGTSPLRKLSNPTSFLAFTLASTPRACMNSGNPLWNSCWTRGSRRHSQFSVKKNTSRYGMPP